MPGLNLSDVIIHIVNVLVLFFLLRLILFKPVNRFLAARTDRIENDLKDAQTAKEDAQKIKTDYEQQMRSYADDGRKLVRESQIKASREASEIVSSAKAEADKLVADAHTRIANEKALAVAEARTEIAMLATGYSGAHLKAGDQHNRQ